MRLRPLTAQRPKPMVPVANRPVMEHLIHLLRENGFRRIYLTTCYLPEHFREVLGDGSRLGVEITYVVEATPLGTAGGVKQLEGELGETFLVISGDCLTDISLADAVAWHKQRGAEATLVVTEVEDPTPYGIVQADACGRVRRFLEKPAPDQVFSRTVNTGIYVLEPAVLERCPRAEPFDFSRDLFPRLVAEERGLYAFHGCGYWSDIGNCKQYVRSQGDALTGRVRLRGLPEPSPGGVWLGRYVRIDRTATLIPPVMLGDGVVVEAGARLGPGAVVGPGCRIESGAVVERSVIWEESSVGKASTLVGAAVGRCVRIGERARLMDVALA